MGKRCPHVARDRRRGTWRHAVLMLKLTEYVAEVKVLRMRLTGGEWKGQMERHMDNCCPHVERDR